MTAELTPSQTIGPFFHHGLLWPDGPQVVPSGTEGAIIISGRVVDGAGEPVADAMVETWQADPDGRFAHPDDPRSADQPAQGAGGSAGGFRAFGRCGTDEDGRWAITTLKPGRVPGPDGALQAPHIDVSLFARGLLNRVVTRIYFADEPQANAQDPVLSSVEPERRQTLIAEAVDGGYRFDIRLQGDGSTVFFDL